MSSQDTEEEKLMKSGTPLIYDCEFSRYNENWEYVANYTIKCDEWIYIAIVVWAKRQQKWCNILYIKMLNKSVKNLNCSSWNVNVIFY